MSPTGIARNSVSNDMICPICLDVINISDKSQRLCCGHDFHRACIVRWDKCRSVCPYCRVPIKYHRDFYFFRDHDLCGQQTVFTISLTPRIHLLKELGESRLRIVDTINLIIRKEIDRKVEAEIERLIPRMANLRLDDNDSDDDL